MHHPNTFPDMIITAGCNIFWDKMDNGNKSKKTRCNFTKTLPGPSYRLLQMIHAHQVSWKVYTPMTKSTPLGQESFNGKKVLTLMSRRDWDNWENSNGASRTFNYKETLTDSSPLSRMAQRTLEPMDCTRTATTRLLSGFKMIAETKS
jgi:hypothetical protein